MPLGVPTPTDNILPEVVGVMRLEECGYMYVDVSEMKTPRVQQKRSH